jgi:23S rRNA (cytosine1962-C5)-methyltransferase
MTDFPFTLLESPRWTDYALLDSGDGLKLERFGKYTFVRPEAQAMWTRALSPSEWNDAHAVFQPTAEESGGHWIVKKKMEEKWAMSYDLTPGPSPEKRGETLRFWTMTTPGRHLGVFPEVAAHWDFMADSIKGAGRSAKVLNLFGYTGLASLAAAAAGAHVTHVDASKKSVAWARENQSLSKLDDKPIRWIVEDAVNTWNVRRGAARSTMASSSTRPSSGAGPKARSGKYTSRCPVCWRPAALS